jgi:hypothetical protein
VGFRDSILFLEIVLLCKWWREQDLASPPLRGEPFDGSKLNLNIPNKNPAQGGAFI